MSNSDRIVQARLKLRARFLAQMAASPGHADPAPQGSGPPNRHGMPRLPVGQTPTAPGKWPVLDLGVHPDIPLARFRLRLDGACAHPQILDWEGFSALEQAEDVSDFHCVTGWSRMDIPWGGVRFATIAALADPDEAVRHVRCYAADGYVTNLSLVEALKDDVLLVHRVDGGPLPVEHGGPVRMITPQLYAWKGAKWIDRVEFLIEDQPGFWEENGYSNTAHPWRNDRYSR
jgi:DMSO/TMAO reductase YedYZ molybdopterin-dependent catalytic subunit